MIKNLLFDFGGVIMNINYRLTINEFNRLGYPAFEEMYAQYTASPLFEKLETGNVSEDTFYSAMQAMAPQPVSVQTIRDAWNAMLIGFNKETITFLETLRPHYRMFLLSNTNIIHKRAFDEMLMRTHGIPAIDVFFEKAYYSHLIGLRKPHPEVFEFVLKDAAIDPAETLFIEDSINNLAAAEKFGIRGLLIAPGENLHEKLDHLISSKSI